MKKRNRRKTLRTLSIAGARRGLFKQHLIPTLLSRGDWRRLARISSLLLRDYPVMAPVAVPLISEVLTRLEPQAKDPKWLSSYWEVFLRGPPNNRVGKTRSKKTLAAMKKLNALHQEMLEDPNAPNTLPDPVASSKRWMSAGTALVSGEFSTVKKRSTRKEVFLIMKKKEEEKEKQRNKEKEKEIKVEVEDESGIDDDDVFDSDDSDDSDSDDSVDSVDSDDSETSGDDESTEDESDSVLTKAKPGPSGVNGTEARNKRDKGKEPAVVAPPVQPEVTPFQTRARSMYREMYHGTSSAWAWSVPRGGGLRGQDSVASVVWWTSGLVLWDAGNWEGLVTLLEGADILAGAGGDPEKMAVVDGSPTAKEPALCGLMGEAAFRAWQKTLHELLALVPPLRIEPDEQARRVSGALSAGRPSTGVEMEHLGEVDESGVWVGLVLDVTSAWFGPSAGKCRPILWALVRYARIAELALGAAITGGSGAEIHAVHRALVTLHSVGTLPKATPLVRGAPLPEEQLESTLDWDMAFAVMDDFCTRFPNNLLAMNHLRQLQQVVPWGGGGRNHTVN